MERNRISGVYAITPEMQETAALVAKVGAALAGGVRLVQYRNKTGSGTLRREQCTALLERLRPADGMLIVNDDVDLALEVGAHGVHLGKDDQSITRARRLLGSDKIIGVSCYNEAARARAAQSAGADYVAFGSFFSSVTKPAAVSAPFDLLARAKAELAVPVVAIGGINRHNAPALIAAGADALAVLNALFCADDIEQEARALSRLMAQRRLQFQF